MAEETKLALFDNRAIRREWNSAEQEWYWSVADVCNVLSESTSSDENLYWRTLKKRLIDEGNETVSNCNGLKMLAKDGKMRMTDVMTTEGILRVAKFAELFLAIKDCKVLGAYNTFEQALESTVKQGHEKGTFIVQHASDDPYAYTAYYANRHIKFA